MCSILIRTWKTFLLYFFYFILFCAHSFICALYTVPYVHHTITSEPESRKIIHTIPSGYRHTNLYRREKKLIILKDYTIFFLSTKKKKTHKVPPNIQLAATSKVKKKIILYDFLCDKFYTWVEKIKKKNWILSREKINKINTV